MSSRESGPLRILVFGAHPDDAEFHAGALLVACRRAGHEVHIVSVTDGSAGYHELTRDEVTTIRREEAAAAGRVIGARYDTWDFPDGLLTPSLEVRAQIIRTMREFRPDVVLTHRMCDYHPDHRSVAQAVDDAIFLVTVPKICPETPALKQAPVLLYMSDHFTRPSPMHADCVLDATPYVEDVISMLVCHVTQVFEWLPWLDGTLDQVPADDAGRRDWVAAQIHSRLARRADAFRDQLIAVYGAERGARIPYAEVYDVSELGRPLDDGLRHRLFPVPGKVT